MGIPTLISTCTADGDALCAFTSGITSTYDEYMFVFTDISNTATNNDQFLVEFSTDGGSSYGLATTSTSFSTNLGEDGSSGGVVYYTAYDEAQSTSGININFSMANDADSGSAGIMHLFSPSNTTYVKHWYTRWGVMRGDANATDQFHSGYVNTTSDIDAVKFVMITAQDFSGVIQMYGIA